MAKNARKSIYKKEIKEIYISNILGNVIDECANHEWDLDLHSDWVQKVEKAIKKLDFWSYNYILNSSSYWCGILTLEPFNMLEATIGGEEDILNMIKDEHFKIIETKDEGYKLCFYNPTKSPLYRFFNKHKEDGYGGNVTYSVNLLLSKVAKFIEAELGQNLSSYGEWIPCEEEIDEIC